MIGKSVFIALLLVTVASATVPARGPCPPTSYVCTPHAKAVANVCKFATESHLCCKTLRRVKSDDPKVLVTTYVSLTASALNRSLSFLNAVRPKYNSDATSAACFDVCTKSINYALEDLDTFKTKAGNDIKSLEMNYSALLQLTRSVFRYTGDCLDDILDENLLKVVKDGIAEGRNMSSNAVDIFFKLNDVFGNFGIQVNLI